MGTTLSRRGQQVEGILNLPQTLGDRIDRFGALQSEIEGLEAKAEKRLKAIHEEISERQDAMAALRVDIEAEATSDLDNEAKTTEVGTLFVAEIGKCAMKRKVTDMKELAKLVGRDNFFALCTFPLGKVDDYLNPHQREKVLDVTHDGARSFKVKPRS